MKNITSLCLTSLLIASANAASYDTKGRTLNGSEIKNPGIVSYEKTNAKKQSSIQKASKLAKTYAVDPVTPLEGYFDTEEFGGTYITLNGDRYYQSEYKSVIKNYEQEDKPRKSYNTKKINYFNSAPSYPSNSGYDCKLVSASFLPAPYDKRRGHGHEYEFSNKNDVWYFVGYSPSNRCHTDWEVNACGNNVNIYNVVGDNAISINSNSCKNTTSRDYTLGIKHKYANSYITEISPNAIKTIINEGDARTMHEFAVYSKYPTSSSSEQTSYLEKPLIINTIASSTKDVNVYNEEAAGIDDYIYYNRAIEFVPYTEDGQKTGAGLSLNAITVGEVDYSVITHTYGLGYPYLKASESRSRYSKPEIQQLSYIRDESHLIKLTKNNQSEYKIAGITDSWGGSSVAAAMTANMISKYPFYAWHPEVVKAVWITAQNDKNAQEVQHYAADEGTTAVSTGSHVAKMEALVKNNRSRYWYGNNGDFFNNNKITFTENVEPGKKYSLAIAWLVSGNYTYNEHSLQSNYKMTVRYKNYQTQQGYTPPSTSSQVSATYRMLNITIPSTVSQIEVEIQRVKNSGDRVVLGYNLHKSN